MSDISKQIESIVLNIHRRNGGQLGELDLRLRLLDKKLLLDSLDLAEIVVSVEKRFGVSAFDSSVPPRTWGELVSHIETKADRNH